MALTVPRGERARIAWHDASGRVPGSRASSISAAGRNPASPCPGCRATASISCRITLPGRTLAWKALLLGGPLPGPAGAGPKPGPPPGGLSKAAAALTDLVVTKTGFRPATYRPSREVEPGAWWSSRRSRTPASSTPPPSRPRTPSIAPRANGSPRTRCPHATGPSPVKTVVKDTSRFAVRDGKLYQYYPGQCMGEVLTGGNSDVVGTWNLPNPRCSCRRTCGRRPARTRSSPRRCPRR